jgi:hypothetical protein
MKLMTRIHGEDKATEVLDAEEIHSVRKEYLA